MKHFFLLFQSFLIFVALAPSLSHSIGLSATKPPQDISFECGGELKKGKKPKIVIEGENHVAIASMQTKAANLLLASRGEILFAGEGFNPLRFEAGENDFKIEVGNEVMSLKGGIYPLEA